MHYKFESGVQAGGGADDVIEAVQTTVNRKDRTFNSDISKPLLTASSDFTVRCTPICPDMSCAEFMEWVVKHGAENFGVDVKECSDEEGKGLYATTDFRENQTVICIPAKLIISAGLVADMPNYCDVFRRHHLKPFEALVYFFMVEKQKNSKWAPYFKVLPTSFSTPAISYPNLEPEHFPFDLRKSWYDQKRELKAMYKKFKILLGDGTSRSHFLWAWHVVNTRCIYHKNKPHPLIDNSQGDDAIAVIPLIDMLNHSNENQDAPVKLPMPIGQDASALDGQDVAARSDCKVPMSLRFSKRYPTMPQHDAIVVPSKSRQVVWIGFDGKNWFLKRNLILCAQFHAIPPYFLLTYLSRAVAVLLNDMIYYSAYKTNAFHHPEDFMRLARIAGISFSDLHRKVVLQANFPCTLYATDEKPSFGFRANLAVLTMDYSKLEHWAKVIYEDAEAVNDDVFKIIRLLRSEMVKDGNRSPQEVQWLWKEQIALLDTLLTNHTESQL